nr:MAG TPA: hypothetical protein [Caudoviricetes sp.]
MTSRYTSSSAKSGLESYKSRGDYLGSLNNIKIIYFHLI